MDPCSALDHLGELYSGMLNVIVPLSLPSPAIIISTMTIIGALALTIIFSLIFFQEPASFLSHLFRISTTVSCKHSDGVAVFCCPFLLSSISLQKKRVTGWRTVSHFAFFTFLKMAARHVSLCCAPMLCSPLPVHLIPHTKKSKKSVPCFCITISGEDDEQKSLILKHFW